MNEKEEEGRAFEVVWYVPRWLLIFWGVNKIDVHIKLAKHIIH